MPVEQGTLNSKFVKQILFGIQNVPSLTESIKNCFIVKLLKQAGAIIDEKYGKKFKADGIAKGHCRKFCNQMLVKKGNKKDPSSRGTTRRRIRPNDYH